jgi:serine/threonine protein kinase
MANRDTELPETDAEASEKYCPSCDGSFPLEAVHCPNDGTRLVRLTPAIDPLLGVVIDGRFRIKARLGAGGMGAVYRAWQGSVGRDVAVKLIEARLSQGKMAAKRFLRESKLTSRLSHPNTVTVLDFGQTDDGMLYLVMELVKGRTLNQVLQQEGRFSLSRMVRVAVQLCDALEAAHGLSIIHRDLKPSNIILLDEPRGRDHVKVLDFGLAKSLVGDDEATTMTHSDAIMGTPAYISPEAALASKTDERADLYSLGVILYELIAGRLPFAAATVNVMISRHAHDPPGP